MAMATMEFLPKAGSQGGGWRFLRVTRWGVLGFTV